MKSISELMKEALVLKATQDVASQVDKRQNLRFGNSGILYKDRPVGSCARRAVLRYHGIDESFPADKELMFEAGRRNEDTWYELLSSVWDGKVLREEEFPAEYMVDGFKVTGRPDIVLYNKKPLQGLELKNVSSVWTFLRVIAKRTPKMDHLIQAAHYGLALDIPFELWYTSSVNWAIVEWMTKQVPEHGEPGSEYFEYSYRRLEDRGEVYKSGKRKGQAKMFRRTVHLAPEFRNLSDLQLRKQFGIEEIKPKTALPTLQGYELDWDGDCLVYRCLQEGAKWQDTIITKSGITSYYKALASSIKKEEQLPRPNGLKADGTPENFKLCDYCSFKGACDTHENEFVQWLDKCRTISNHKE